MSFIIKVMHTIKIMQGMILYHVFVHMSQIKAFLVTFFCKHLFVPQLWRLSRIMRMRLQVIDTGYPTVYHIFTTEESAELQQWQWIKIFKNSHFFYFHVNILVVFVCHSHWGLNALNSFSVFGWLDICVKEYT